MQRTTKTHIPPFVIRHAITGALGMGLLLSLTPPVRAFTGGIPTLSFAMPTAVDPAKLFLYTPGQLYTNTNDPANPNGNGPITGLTLLPTQSGGLGGLEIHERFDVKLLSLSTPVTELDVMTDYPSPFLITPTSLLNDPNTGQPFVPWKAADQGFTNNTHKIILTPQPGSAPLAQGGYYAVLSADSSLDTPLFRQSHFSFIGNPRAANTPEPGMGALLLASGIAGAMLRRKRGKRGGADLAA